MRLQLLHFHVVFKTWPSSEELTSIVSFRRRHWNFGKNRNMKGNQSKYILNLVKYEDYGEIFFLPPDLGIAVVICLRSLFENSML